ncbi:MAG: DUF4145 domain-containing protein [Spirochaetia bacterium]|nr:DUF4145 domain-containing protein [Spirochaetia bacterium]
MHDKLNEYLKIVDDSYEAPVSRAIHIRKICEYICNNIINNSSISDELESNSLDKQIKVLYDNQIISSEIKNILYRLKKLGNISAHDNDVEIYPCDVDEVVGYVHDLYEWFMKYYGNTEYAYSENRDRKASVAEIAKIEVTKNIHYKNTHSGVVSPVHSGSYKCCSLEAFKKLETDVAHEIEYRQKSFVEHISGFFEKLLSHKRPENPESEVNEKRNKDSLVSKVVRRIKRVIKPNEKISEAQIAKMSSCNGYDPYNINNTDVPKEVFERNKSENGL